MDSQAGFRVFSSASWISKPCRVVKTVTDSSGTLHRLHSISPGAAALQERFFIPELVYFSCVHRSSTGLVDSSELIFMAVVLLRLIELLIKA